MINFKRKPKLDPIMEPIEAVRRSLATGQAVMARMLRTMTFNDKARLMAAASTTFGDVEIRFRTHRDAKVSVEIWSMLIGTDEGIRLLSSEGPVDMPAAPEVTP